MHCHPILQTPTSTGLASVCHIYWVTGLCRRVHHTAKAIWDARWMQLRVDDTSTSYIWPVGTPMLTWVVSEGATPRSFLLSPAACSSIHRATPKGTPVNLSGSNSLNTSTSAVPVELKVWLEVPGVGPLTISRGGADGSVAFPAGLVAATKPPFTLFTVELWGRARTYLLGCRLVHPVTGKTKGRRITICIVVQ